MICCLRWYWIKSSIYFPERINLILKPVVNWFGGFAYRNVFHAHWCEVLISSAFSHNISDFLFFLLFIPTCFVFSSPSRSKEEYLTYYYMYFLCVEHLFTSTCEQDLWSGNFWKSSRTSKELESIHCWEGKIHWSTLLNILLISILKMSWGSRLKYCVYILFY